MIGMMFAGVGVGQAPVDVKVMSSNFAFDLAGPQDTRDGTWGTADDYVHKVEFTPPTGQQTVVHSISGDIVAWVRVHTQGKFGVLYGFQQYEKNRGGGGECGWCDITTMLYGQTGASSQEVATRKFNKRYIKPILLPENKLWVKGASWLNDTGQAVHFEITFTVEYEFRSRLMEDILLQPSPCHNDGVVGSCPGGMDSY
jgi:hypothetical protein